MSGQVLRYNDFELIAKKNKLKQLPKAQKFLNVRQPNSTQYKASGGANLSTIDVNSSLGHAP